MTRHILPNKIVKYWEERIGDDIIISVLLMRNILMSVAKNCSF